MESGLNAADFLIIFEDMRSRHLLNTQTLHDHVMVQAERPEGNVYLFFDAIQDVQDCEKCINSFRAALDRDIYITGSNANLLSGELSTHLGGRYVEFVFYLFSFGEFMELYRTV